MHNFFFYQIPSVYLLPDDDRGLWVNIILAFIIFLAVVVAFLQEEIRRRANQATLDMDINLIPPDSHQIEMTSPEGLAARKTIYIRIRVKHLKGRAGENVEIMPVSFSRVDASGRLTPIESFFPISLVWSHFQPRVNTTRVPVSLFRFCDFGHVIGLHPSNDPMLILDTIVQPNRVSGGEIPNFIKAGKYQFELLLSGDNVKVLKKKWEIEIVGWSDDEKIMLTENLKITEIK